MTHRFWGIAVQELPAPSNTLWYCQAKAQLRSAKLKRRFFESVIRQVVSLALRFAPLLFMWLITPNRLRIISIVSKSSLDLIHIAMYSHDTCFYCSFSFIVDNLYCESCLELFWKFVVIQLGLIFIHFLVYSSDLPFLFGFIILIKPPSPVRWLAIGFFYCFDNARLGPFSLNCFCGTFQFRAQAANIYL